MAADEDNTSDDDGASAGRSGSMLRTLIVGAVFLVIGAGAGVFGMPLVSAATQPAAEEVLSEGGEPSEAMDGEMPEGSTDEAKKAKKKKPKKKDKKKSKGKDKGKDSSILDLEPMVVSLYNDRMATNRGAPRLRLAISVDLGELGAPDGTRQRLRHSFINALQELDAADLRAQGGLSLLTATLQGAAEGALGESIGQVFITEFIVL